MYLRTCTPRLFSALALLLGTLALATTAAADTIDLMWDPNPEPAVVGYIVHIGTQPGSPTQSIDVGPTTTWSFAGAMAGQQYCFTVSAYFSGPIEGPSSNEVCGISNAYPVLANPGSQTSLVGQAASLQLAGSDPEGLPITYSATGLPPGLSVMASTGFISGTPATAGAYAVTARASDGVLTTSQTFTWTVAAPDLTAPVVAITSPTSAPSYIATSTPLALGGTASDNVGVTQVSWVNSRGGGGVATGTAPWTVSGIALQAGSNVLTVTARDAAGNTSSAVLTVTLNGAPSLASVASQSATVGLPTTLQLTGTDPNGDPLTYSAAGLPPGLSLGAASGLIAGTPTVVGTYAVTVSVSDGTLSASQGFTWTIVAGTSTPGTLQLQWDPVPDPAVLGYMVYVGTQPGLYSQSIDVGLTTSWVFPNPVPGQQYCFAVTAYVAGHLEGPKSAEVCGYSNEPPTLASVGNQSTTQGQAGALQLAGSDPDGMPLSYSATGLPPGLSVAPSTGLISGTATTAGTYTVTATVSDGVLTASQTFTWTVVAVDTTPPTVTIVTPTSTASWSTSTATVSLGGTASDNVGVTQVSWVNSAGGSGTASGTTGWSASVTLQSGVNVLTVAAGDAAGNTATAVLTVTYTPASTFQVTSLTSSLPSPQKAWTVIVFSVAAAGDVGPYEYQWRVFDGSTWKVAQSWQSVTTFTWLPKVDGSYQIEATARSATGATALQTTPFVIGSGAPADTTPPTVAITAPTTAATFNTALGNITLSGTASDNVGVTQVSWVNSRGGSGAAAGTTAWNAAIALSGGVNVLTVTARDAAGNASSATLTVTRNTAPTLAAVADQWTEVGRAAVLQLTATDPDGDALTFGVNGLPPGFALGVTTGLLAGTPTVEGTYPVTVTVSDGVLTATQSFTWTVTPETVAPVVAISSPTASATYSTGSATITLGGTASDNVGVTQVSWVNSAGGSGTATGTTGWSATVALQSGVNVLTVTARDAAGNTAAAVLTVTYTPAPALQVTSVTSSLKSPEKAWTVIVFTVSAAGDVAPYEYQWRVFDGSSWNTVQGWSTPVTFTWLPKVKGTYQIEVTARSATGATATRTVPFRIN